MWCWIPDFAGNHTIYFTYFEYFDKTVYNTAIARAVLDESAGAIRDVKVLLKTHPFAPNDQTLAAGTKTGGRIAVGRMAISMSRSVTATMPARGPGRWRNISTPIWAR